MGPRVKHSVPHCKREVCLTLCCVKVLTQLFVHGCRCTAVLQHAERVGIDAEKLAAARLAAARASSLTEVWTGHSAVIPPWSCADGGGCGLTQGVTLPITTHTSVDALCVPLGNSGHPASLLLGSDVLS